MLIEMKVFALTVDPFTNAPIIILKDLDDKNALPVWIGPPEASAIASELNDINHTRPMTHDLILEIIKGLSACVEKVEITDIRNNVFYASIHVLGTAGLVIIDARPSDAIAIALKASSTIYVDTKVLDKSKTVDLRATEGVEAAETPEELLNMLKEFEPREFGKYKM